METLVKVDAATAPDGTLIMPARDIPLPSTVSEQARAYLAMPRPPFPDYPALDNKDAWRRIVASRDKMFLDLGGERVARTMARAERHRIAETDVYVAAPREGAARPGKLCLSFHGGALLFFGGSLTAFDAARSSDQTGCVTWSVDYAMPPDAPYPAGLDQAVAVYREALKTHAADDIVFNGISAGGNIAAATILKARDSGLPLPAAAILRTPELDLTESGDSFATHMGIDNVLPNPLVTLSALYAGGADLADPYLSPLFGDFTKGFPRTWLQAGTRDLFLSNCARMHRSLLKAGVAAELHVWEAMPHAGFGGISPEDREMDAAIGDFTSRLWP
ncbi:MAG: alpha/beta hydrolase [Micropepsaceae bacterium]